MKKFIYLLGILTGLLITLYKTKKSPVGKKTYKHLPSLNIKGDTKFLEQLIQKTKENKYTWVLLPPRIRKPHWQLDDACNVIQTTHNGVSLRLCQHSKSAKFFLHITNGSGDPVCMNYEQGILEELLKAIALNLPPLARILAIFNNPEKYLKPNKNENISHQ